MPTNPKYQSLLLPTEKQGVLLDLKDYLILAYGERKIGKTTFFSSFPDALFLMTEPGAKGMEIFSFNHPKGITDWNILRAAVQQLEDNPDQFSTVVIDTVDRAYDMCQDWVCESLGITYPGANADGVNDYGKSWNAVKREFMDMIYRICQSGRGVCFTSHMEEREIRMRGGDTFTQIQPSMSKQALKIIVSACDIILYAQHVRDKEGNDKRILVTQGDELVMAGCRKIAGRTLPHILPLTEEGGYDMLQAALNGTYDGLDPATLMPRRKATTAERKVLRDATMEPKKKPIQKPLKRRSN